jgi:hypothetical protein
VQTVTEADVLPAGFVCDNCDKPFKPGDTAYGTPTAMAADGTPVEELVCVTCWHTEEN